MPKPRPGMALESLYSWFMLVRRNLACLLLASCWPPPCLGRASTVPPACRRCPIACSAGWPPACLLVRLPPVCFGCLRCASCLPPLPHCVLCPAGWPPACLLVCLPPICFGCLHSPLLASRLPLSPSGSPAGLLLASAIPPMLPPTDLPCVHPDFVQPVLPPPVGGRGHEGHRSCC